MPPTKRADAETQVPDLTARLTQWRHTGDTYAEIAWRLREHGVNVTAETVRQWCGDAA